MYPIFKIDPDPQDLSHIDLEKYKELIVVELQENKIYLSLKHENQHKNRIGYSVRLTEEVTWKEINNHLVIAKKMLINSAIGANIINP